MGARSCISSASARASRNTRSIDGPGAHVGRLSGSNSATGRRFTLIRSRSPASTRRRTSAVRLRKSREETSDMRRWYHNCYICLRRCEKASAIDRRYPHFSRLTRDTLRAWPRFQFATFATMAARLSIGWKQGNVLQSPVMGGLWPNSVRCPPARFADQPC